MSEINWRMPKPGEHLATVQAGLNEADVSEALNRPIEEQLRVYRDLVLAIAAETDGHVLLRALLLREDDSFVWVVRSVRIAGVLDRQDWMKRGDR